MVDFSVLLSNLIGALIIFGSLTVKIPLIRNCVEAKSTEGLAESSLISEILSLTISICYNILNGIPISTWGEFLTVQVQNFVILSLIWYYGRRPLFNPVWKVGAYIGFIFFLMALLPSSLRFLMPISGMIVSWSGHIPQIMTNYENKHTGPLALETQSITTLGAYLRLFTTLVQVDDPLVLFAVVVGTGFQTTILGQILFYRENTKRVLAGLPIEEPESIEEDGSVMSLLSAQILKALGDIWANIKSSDLYYEISNLMGQASELYNRGISDAERIYSESMESDVATKTVGAITSAKTTASSFLDANLAPAKPLFDQLNEITFDEVVDSGVAQIEPIVASIQADILKQVDPLMQEFETQVSLIKEKVKTI
mmetsp:Transcript_14935/g.16895  ORF Transcript_14935/g.16895 Transcript_14935/m.16895 type:complete len:369 (+) Transcript_14935:60-1166(+)|eukprot:CAMPEP_0184038526 /NCGR_PEP_ID=MMETSP0955-20130417/47472_1 /TAXON_ID=627963 /ORGANISM="Aplanochytrium sp, Strain PBS07" /LENGTH=368 /DNA_ID=CAMNT_0026327219 /DNA_START=142 /DNA_END=1248 /DNA_ORIENTATION=-